MKALPTGIAFEKVFEDHERTETGYGGQLIMTDPFQYPEGMEEGEQPQPEAQDYKQLSDVFAKIGQWIYRDGRGNQNGIKARFYAFIWLTSPGTFDNRNEAEMARHIGVSRKRFSLAVTSFKDEFKFCSSLTKTEGMRAKLSAAAKRRHERERQNKKDAEKN